MVKDIDRDLFDPLVVHFHDLYIKAVVLKAVALFGHLAYLLHGPAADRNDIWLVVYAQALKELLDIGASQHLAFILGCVLYPLD